MLSSPCDVIIKCYFEIVKTVPAVALVLRFNYHGYVRADNKNVSHELSNKRLGNKMRGIK